MKIIRAFALTLAVTLGSSASAQTTRTNRDTVEAYGARLTDTTDAGPPVNARRVNNRLSTRINNRISTRIERYRTGSAAEPVAALRQGDTAPTPTTATPTPDPIEP